MRFINSYRRINVSFTSQIPASLTTFPNYSVHSQATISL